MEHYKQINKKRAIGIISYFPTHIFTNDRSFLSQPNESANEFSNYFSNMVTRFKISKINSGI